MNELQHHIAVIGSGVIGLTTALALQSKGHRVTVFHKPKDTNTSASIPCVFWWPHTVTEDIRIREWAKYTYSKYASCFRNASSGVERYEFHRYCLEEDPSLFALDLFSDWDERPTDLARVSCLRSLITRIPKINTGKFLSYLRLTLEENACTFIPLELSSLHELRDQFSTVINCSGLGARELVQDNLIYPIRGQVVIGTHKTLDTSCARIYKKAATFSTVIPCEGRLMLSGVAQKDDWSLTPRDDDSKDIIKRCSLFEPELSDFLPEQVFVGLRPARPQVRLEVEELASGMRVIHNYGHGGSGYTLCWGCAEEVCRLI